MQDTLRAALVRGGTSRGLFLWLEDLPAAGADRDALLIELMGSPDPIQVDGVGGGHSHTSKVMAIAPSPLVDVDVDYVFAQVDVRRPFVDYGGNCGNLTAAVGLFAVEEGLARVPEADSVAVMLRCLNTDSRVRVNVPLRDGRARTDGEFRMAGILHPGARILVDYLEPEGAMLQKGVFPDGGPTSIVELDGEDVRVSIVDLTGPYVFVRASDLGIAPPFVPERLNGDRALLDRIERLRGVCSVRLGMVDHVDDAARRTPAQPKVVLCAPPQAYETSTGASIAAEDVDIVATMASVQRIHHAFAGTGVMCAAGAARFAETVVGRMARLSGPGEVRVGHPKGIATAEVEFDDAGLRVVSVGVPRTARTIMTGMVHHRATRPTF